MFLLCPVYDVKSSASLRERENKKCSRKESNLQPPDPKSGASANWATRAKVLLRIKQYTRSAAEVLAVLCGIASGVAPKHTIEKSDIVIAHLPRYLADFIIILQ